MVENDSENFWESYLSGAQAINRFPSALDAGCEPFVDEGDGNATIASSHAASTVDGDISDIILIASWILVVSLHSLQDDIIVGLDLEGRTEGKVPFRIQIPETNESSLADLIANVTTSLDAVLSVVTNADSAKEQWNRISRSTQGCEGEVWDFSSCLQVVSQTSKSTPPQTQCCPLMVLCKRNNGSTTLVMNARESTYTKPVQQAMMVHFQRAITTLSSSDHVSINELDLLSDFDGDKLSGWAQNPDTVPSQPFLHQAIEEQARQRPLSVAIGQTDMVMTYGELNEGGHVLSQHLRDQASSQGAKIGNIAIVFAKSAFAVLAMLAVLKAGGAYVPIDPQWPVRRVSKILADAQTSTILCAEDQISWLQDSYPDRTSIAVTPRSIYDLKKASRSDIIAPSPVLHPEDVAYIIYTSGSTGDPKGVAISHGSIATAISAIARYFVMSTSTRALQFNAFTFDVSVFDIWGTLSRGGRLCMPTESERFALNEFIGNERCNFALVTPSIAATIDPSVVKRYLHTLATIGETTSPDHLRRYAPSEEISKSEDGWQVLDTYGPTEASVIATGTAPFTVRRGSNGRNHLLSQQPGNIGKPLGCGLFLVSPRNPHRLSPAFAPGEIALVGPTLATMYWGDEDKTRSAFRSDLRWAKDRRWTNRFGVKNMRRVYLTGDIARYSEYGDGSVVYMYRRGGGYLKVNGLRIDPGEVEAAVAEVGLKTVSRDTTQEAPLWDKAAVCCLDRGEGGDQTQILVCFLAQNDTKATSEPGTFLAVDMTASRKSLMHDLASQLRDVIPEYMRPRLYVLISRMPMSTSGKLDRKALLSLLDGMAWNEIVHKYGVSQNTTLNGQK